ncbi:MAG: hypothetical protein L3J16_06045 [Anaerolineales bacterium]|nr:hypothetical protein [Anaerolineales bacterium]
MRPIHRLRPIRILPLFIFITLSSCAPTRIQPTLAPVSATPATSPSATVIWFPPTKTRTPHPAQKTPATPQSMPGLGEVLYTETFATDSNWNTGASDAGSISISRNRITFAVQPQVFMLSLRNQPILTNFFAQVNAHTSLCRAEDSYGMLFRVSNLVYYRYALDCNGTIRLERFNNGVRRTLQARLPSGDVPPGSPGDVRLGVWTAGAEMRFFVNGHYQFSVVDANIPAGTLGLFAHSMGETAMTVTFSDLVVQSVAYVSPTPTITPSKTSAPTSTMRP